jgi:deazaflavin-dependent oxidoreductase (nitroreductase family)
MRRRLARAGLRSVGAAHRVLYRASGGAVGGRLHGMSILLLTTIGRVSGAERTVPLTFVRDGDGFVVIASNGGMAWPPAWWLNLSAHPEATVQIGRARHTVRGRTADGAERARLWELVTERHPVYARYQQKTVREIPVVILTAAA